MKKFIIILAAFVALAANAQTGETTVSLGKDVLLYTFDGQITDTVGLVDSLWTKQISIDGNTGSALYYNFSVKLKEGVSGIGKTDCVLLGKIFNGDSWSTITTTSYWATGTDTTIKFTQNTTKQFYNHYGVRLEKQTGTSKVYPQYIYLYLKKQ